MTFCLEFTWNVKEISFLKCWLAQWGNTVSFESQKHIHVGGFPGYSWSDPSSVFTRVPVATPGENDWEHWWVERSSPLLGVCPELAGKHGSEEKAWDLGITLHRWWARIIWLVCLAATEDEVSWSGKRLKFHGKRDLKTIWSLVSGAVVYFFFFLFLNPSLISFLKVFVLWPFVNTH